MFADPIKTVYLGAGAIGIGTLDALVIDRRLDLLAVVTQPDRPAGRRQRLTPTPVAQFARDREIQLFQPRSVNDDAFLETMRILNPDILLVLSFGQILRPPLLALPPWGCLNVHTSILPRHRGAAPVAAAIAAGDRETGISFMKMDAGLDTGPVYKTHTLPIAADDTTESLSEKLGKLAAQHVGNCIVTIVRNGIQPRPQDQHQATTARKIRKDDAVIDWSQPADTVERRIRALIPWPKAGFTVNIRSQTKRLQVTKATPIRLDAEPQTPGEILQANRDGWLIACGQNALRVERVIPEGRSEMTAESFLRGHPVEIGTRVDDLESGGPNNVQHETDST